MPILYGLRSRRGIKRLDSLVKDNSIDRRLLDLNKASSIGVLCAPNDFSQFKELISLFKLIFDKKNIKVLVWYGWDRTKSMRMYSLPHWVTEFTKQDLDYDFLPKAQFLKDFVDTPFDVLLVFGNQNKMPVRAIITMSKAKCRMGTITDSEECLCDFSVGQGKNYLTYTDAISDMFRYSKNFV